MNLREVQSSEKVKVCQRVIQLGFGSGQYPEAEQS